MRRPTADAPAWLDGKKTTVSELQVPFSDPAFLAGLGLFETIAARAGRAVDATAHLERLYDGARVLGIELPELERMRATLAEAAQSAPRPYAWIKIVATRERHALFSGTFDAAQIGRPSSAVVLPWRRNPADPLSGLKTLSYAANVYAQEYARERGADEGLWLNTRNHLAEGCISNLFVIRHGRLFTPAVRDGLLPGTVRGLVLQAARSAGWAVHEGKLRLPRLRHADEAFLTSSLRGLRPLVSVDGRPIRGGKPGRKTAELAEAVEALREFG
ncbi:MAG: aminotransferase class IV [bacterium]|nr:aminotransferase class IV [bacterium]